VIFIRGSLQRIEEFLEIQVANLTRWNSTNMMMERGLCLKDAIDIFITRHLRALRDLERTLERDQLSLKEWDQLQHLFDLLEPFRRLTLRLQGHAKLGS
jgi:hypothetical protein